LAEKYFHLIHKITSGSNFHFIDEKLTKNGVKSGNTLYNAGNKAPFIDQRPFPKLLGYKTYKISRAPLVHAYNSSYSGSRGQWFKASPSKQFTRPYLENTQHKKGLV
jgi:hypothetical protein